MSMAGRRQAGWVPSLETQASTSPASARLTFSRPSSWMRRCLARPSQWERHEKKGFIWISHFGWRPATLFEGVNIPLSISISNYSDSKERVFVTEFNKWYQEKREHITNLLEYNESDDLLLHDFVFPKIGPTYNSIFKKISILFS